LFFSSAIKAEFFRLLLRLAYFQEKVLRHEDAIDIVTENRAYGWRLIAGRPGNEWAAKVV
jgi:hypothetical protein